MKKLLFVANYFPPMASGGNARQLRFLRYLPEFGWEPTVLTCRAKGNVPDPDGVRIVRTLTPSPDPVYEAARSASATARAGGGRRARVRGAARLGRRRPAARCRQPRHRPEALRAPPGPQPLAVRPRPVRRLGRRRRSLVGVHLVRDEGFDADLLELPAAEHRARRCRHRGAHRPAVAGRLPRPLADAPVPPATSPICTSAPTSPSSAGRSATPPWATAVNEPIADDLRRRYPRAARARERDRQRVRPCRDSRGRDARRRVLVRPHRAALLARRPGGALSRRARRAARRRRRAVRRRRRRPYPRLRRFDRASASACAPSPSSRTRARSATSASPVVCCSSPATRPSRCRARSSSTCRAAGRSSP